MAPLLKTANGWPVLLTRPSASFLAPTGKRVWVANDAVAVVFSHIARRWHAEVEPIAGLDSGRVGIHAWRRGTPIAGTTKWSNHTGGVAMDINGHLHPYEYTSPAPYRDGFTAAQRATVRQIAADVNRLAGQRLLRLGLDFGAGRRDGMHVEIAPGVTPADVERAAARLLAPTPPVKPPTKGRPVWDDGVMKRGDRGPEVRDLQEFALRVFPSYAASIRTSGGADGSFGAGAEAWVKEYQRRVGLAADGVIGKRTLAALRRHGYKGGPR